MSFPTDEKRVDDLLADAFGSRPKADFDQWRRQHPGAVEILGAQDGVTIKKRGIQMRRIARIAAAAVVVVGIGIAISYIGRGQNGGVTFAEVCEEIRNVQTYSYTALFIQRYTDGQTTWIVTEKQRTFFKRPGRSRTLDHYQHGKPQAIYIEDHVAGKELLLDLGERRARLIEKGEPTEERKRQWQEDPDEFTYYVTHRITADTESLGKKQIDGREAVGFRVTSEKGPSNDVWVDTKTRRVVLVQAPGADKYVPEEDPARNNPPGKKVKHGQGMCVILKDITYDQELDDSLFRLDPPAGYSLEIIRWVEPNENDVNDWLRTLAEFYGGTFPTWDVTSRFPTEDRRKITEKDEEDRTAVEKKILETRRRYSQYGHRSPIARFVDTTAGDTWHYQGQGVELGDQDAVVWWYKPKDSKNYRVVYGDLTVRVVAPEDLPTRAKPR